MKIYYVELREQYTIEEHYVIDDTTHMYTASTEEKAREYCQKNLNELPKPVSLNSSLLGSWYAILEDEVDAELGIKVITYYSYEGEVERQPQYDRNGKRY